MTRPKSTTPKISSSRIGAMIANSTIAWERWPSVLEEPMSVAPNHHVGVGHYVKGGAHHVGQKPSGEAKAHDEDHIHVPARVRVVRRRECSGEARPVDG